MNIVFDMDETLISTGSRYLREDRTELPIHRLGVIEGVLETAAIRPGTEEILQYCKQNFDKVICCSLSSHDRVRACLGGCGLLKQFDQFYGGDDIEYENGVGPNLGDFVLVDDYESNTDLIVTKLNFFGFVHKKPNFIQISEYHIKVSKFVGSQEDTEFIRLIPRLGARLGK